MVHLTTDCSQHVSWQPCPWCFTFCFARYLPHRCHWALNVFSFLSPTSNKSQSQTLKKHLTATDDAPAVCNSLRLSPTLSLSVHRIQIISHASLCYCTKGMRVFELDLLDNIRSTQICFPGCLFHADRVDPIGTLVLPLYLFGGSYRIRQDNQLFRKLHAKINECFSFSVLMFLCSQVDCVLLCLLKLHSLRSRNALQSLPTRQTAHRCFCLSRYAWWTGLICRPSGKADRLKGEIWSAHVLISSDLLSL